MTDEVLTLIVANTLSVNKANYSSTASGPPSLTREGLRKRCQAHSARDEMPFGHAILSEDIASDFFIKIPSSVAIISNLSFASKP